MTFDLRSPTLRILECSKCDEPVAGEATSSSTTLVCGYCGFEDTRELAGTVVLDAGEDESPYRQAKRPKRPVRANLDVLPEGVEQPRRLELLATMWKAAKRSEAPSPEDVEARSEHDYRLLWLGTGYAAACISRRDNLRARAALETVLELVTHPVHRGLVLARLARLAGFSDAPELGEKWLAAVPLGLRVAEVQSDVTIARAMIAKARKDPREVLRVIGQRDTANEFVGPGRWLALCLRVDAYEELGDHEEARLLWTSSIRGNAVVMGATAANFGLAVATRRSSRRKALLGLPIVLALLYTLVSILVHLVTESPIPGWKLGLLAVSFVLTMLLKRL